MDPRFSHLTTQMFFWIIPLVLFGIILKALALWRAARRGEKWWFIAIFILNTIGILPLLYLLTHPENTTKKNSSK